MSRRFTIPRFSSVVVHSATAGVLFGTSACGLFDAGDPTDGRAPTAAATQTELDTVRTAAPVLPTSFTDEQIEAARQALGDAPLVGGVASLEELGERVVASLNARDLEALEALLVSGSEYKERLFRTLANHPSALTFGADSSWDMTSRETRDDLRRSLERWGGRDLTFVRIEPPASETRRGLTLHRRPKLVVATTEGETFDIAMLGSVVEHQRTQTFKLLSYRDAPWHGKSAAIAQAPSSRSE
jgi:hypothetical protein